VDVKEEEKEKKGEEDEVRNMARCQEVYFLSILLQKVLSDEKMWTIVPTIVVDPDPSLLSRDPELDPDPYSSTNKQKKEEKP